MLRERGNGDVIGIAGSGVVVAGRGGPAYGWMVGNTVGVATISSTNEDRAEAPI